MAAQLDERFPGRVSSRVADAADPASLARAFTGVDLVAVAASVLARAGDVAEAALAAGIDYFDLLMSGRAKFAALDRLAPRIASEGRCFITDGGIHPGLTAALVRALEPAFSSLEGVSVGALFKIDWNTYDFQPATMYEFANEFGDYRLEMLRNGVWTKVTWRDAGRSFDFDPPYDGERCFLMYMKELELLPRQMPSPLRDCAFYISGFNPVVDTVVMPLGMAVMRYSPRTLGGPYARLLTWALRRFSRPPFRIVWQVEAAGELAEKGLGHAVLRLIHHDGYWLTAAAAAACLLQWLDGSLSEPGVHLQALAVEPARFLRDLAAMGVQLTSRGVDVDELIGEVRSTAH